MNPPETPSFSDLISGVAAEAARLDDASAVTRNVF
jgi:hypothetical protein